MVCLHVYQYIHSVHGQGTGGPDGVVTGGCEPPHVSWESNTSPGRTASGLNHWASSSISLHCGGYEVSRKFHLTLPWWGCSSRRANRPPLSGLCDDVWEIEQEIYDVHFHEDRSIIMASLNPSPLHRSWLQIQVTFWISASMWILKRYKSICSCKPCNQNWRCKVWSSLFYHREYRQTTLKCIGHYILATR